MNLNKNNLLTKNQLTFLIIGFALGPGFLKLPNAIIPKAQQDSWISAIIALMYPIYILIIANYIINKHPKENILQLNKKYFGVKLGTFFNLICLFQSIFYTSSIILDFSAVVRIYIVAFLTPIKVIIITILVCAFACSKGLKVLGKISELVSYMLILVIVLSVSALSYGSILNIKPILGSGIKNILMGTKETAYFYTGFEYLLLFHPFAKNTKDIKKASINATVIAGILWTWTVFITIFYLGADIVSKSFYSFVLVFESIHVPIINNFRYVAMFTWTLVSFRIISNYYFSSSFILSDLTKINIQKLNLILSPIVFFLCAYIIPNSLKNEQLMLISNIFVIFNIIFLSILTLFIFIKSKSKIQN